MNSYNTRSILEEIYSLENDLLLSVINSPPLPAATCDCINLNIGSFGNPHPSLLTLHNHIKKLSLSQPSFYHRVLVPLLISRSKLCVSNYFNIPLSDFSFMNISTCIFSILLNSFTWKPGDVILITETIYHSVKDSCLYLSRTRGVAIETVILPPVLDDEIIYTSFSDKVAQLISAGVTIKLSLVDAISSKPSLYYPIARISQLCLANKIPLLVDAAHVPGTIPQSAIKLDHLQGVCWYVMTYHKWFNTYPPCGGVYVNTALLDAYPDVSYNNLIPSSNSSEGGNEGDEGGYYVDGALGIQVNDIVQGIYDESTRDYMNYILLPYAISLSGVMERDRMAKVASLWRGCERLFWRGGVKFSSDCDEGIGFKMKSVVLPTSRLTEAFKNNDLAIVKSSLQNKLWNDYKIEVPVGVWKDEIVVRISFSRDVDVSVLQRFKDVVEEICNT
jgi:hypothetical protein